MNDVSIADEAKIEEVIKWKLEAHQRKLTDRIQQAESKQQTLQRNIDSLQEEYNGDFLALKSLLPKVTSDVLSQVQTSILP